MSQQQGDDKLHDVIKQLCLHAKELGGLLMVQIQIIIIQIMIICLVFALYLLLGIELKSTLYMTDVLMDHLAFGRQ